MYYHPIYDHLGNIIVPSTSNYHTYNSTPIITFPVTENQFNPENNLNNLVYYEQTQPVYCANQVVNQTDLNPTQLVPLYLPNEQIQSIQTNTQQTVPVTTNGISYTACDNYPVYYDFKKNNYKYQTNSQSLI